MTKLWELRRKAEMLTVKGQNNNDGSFDWKNALADALIMSALTFWSALGGLGATGLVTGREVLAAGIAAATQFFIVLTVKRGLKAKLG